MFVPSVNRKLEVAAQVLKKYGLLGVAHKVFGSVGFRMAEGWCLNKLVVRHNPYTGILRERMRCPHCRGLLENNSEGCVCPTCSDIFV